MHIFKPNEGYHSFVMFLNSFFFLSFLLLTEREIGGESGMPEEEIDNIESPVEDESEKKCSVLANIGEKIVFFS